MMMGKPDRVSECVVSLGGEINSTAAMQGCNTHGKVYAQSSGACTRGSERPELRVKGRMLICEALKASSGERRLL